MMKSIKSASLIAISALAEICALIDVGSGSRVHPPVSMTIKFLPFHCASYLIRSRVTPGLSSMIASLRPINRFMRVDLPTFGRPITATIGNSSERSLSALVTITQSKLLDHGNNDINNFI